jgi:hypothetical protein
MSNLSYYQNYDKRTQAIDNAKAKVEEQEKQIKQRQADADKAKEQNRWLNTANSSSNSDGGWLNNVCFAIYFY